LRFISWDYRQYIGAKMVAEYQPQTGKYYYYTTDQIGSYPHCDWWYRKHCLCRCPWPLWRNAADLG